MTIYSHSRLSTFEQCPFKFKLRYIDKIVPELEKNIESHLGSIVHNTLEWIYTEVKNGKLPTVDEVIVYYATNWEENYKPEIVIVKKEFTARDYFDKGVQFLIDYHVKHQPFDDNTLEVEKKIMVELDEEGEYKIQGFIDRLVHNLETGEYEVHDYKTANNLPNKERVENDRQLALYSVAIKELFGHDKEVCLVWHYLAHNMKICSRRTNEQLQKLKKETIELIKKIESTTEFPVNKSILCNWCEYKSMCASWGGEVPKKQVQGKINNEVGGGQEKIKEIIKEERIQDYEHKLLELFLKAENENFDFSHLSPKEILKQIFNYDKFKHQQLKIINRILNKEGDTLGIMPTGGGKSLCFHIPSLIQKNLTIVVSPLIALMKDQIDNLIKNDIHTAFFINSSISENAKKRILNLVERKKIKLLYLAPESLKSEMILNVLKKVEIDLFVIDEAHCISTWGHNFRPDYLKLPEIIENLNNPQTLSLTATATKEVEKDIQKQLKTKCKVFKASFDRPNLYIEMIPISENIKKELFLVDLLKKIKGSTIIFVSYRKTSEKISEILNLNGIKSVFYHAGLDRENREKIQNKFISGQCEVIVATIAFGMGIDKPDIRNVIHYNISQSIENYYQEIGRAGRDGESSNCIVLLTKKDEHKIKDLISSSWPNKYKINNIISYLKDRNTNYFFTTSRKICSDCNIKEIPTNLILHRLERARVIKIFTNVIYQIKPLFTKDTIKILEENPKYKKDLERIFSCDFFKDNRRKWLVFEELMDETGLNYFRILEILNHLKEEGYLKFSEVIYKDLIWVKEEINNFEVSPLVELFNSILNKDLSKVDLLIENLTKKSCIRKNILKYFDEPHLKNKCDMCSYCLGDRLAKGISPKINKNYVNDKEIDDLKDLEINDNELPSTFLINILQNKEIPKKDFVKILIGDLHHFSSNWKFNLDCYGILDNFKNQEIILEEILKSLINKELVNEEMDGNLRITKKGIKYLLNLKSSPKNKKTTRNHSLPWVLGENKNPKDILKLIEFTKSMNANERRISASALGKMSKLKPEIYEAVPNLIHLLKDKKPQVRQYAIKSLGLIKDKRAKPYLEIIAKNDEKEYNQRCAENSIKNINHYMSQNPPDEV